MFRKEENLKDYQKKVNRKLEEFSDRSIKNGYSFEIKGKKYVFDEKLGTYRVFLPISTRGLRHKR